MSHRPTPSGVQVPAGDATPPQGTSRISGPRVQGRARVAKILNELSHAGPLNQGTSLVDAWAARGQVSDETIYNWCDPRRTTACPAAGDLDAILDDADFERFVARWREERAARARPVAPATDPVHEVGAIMVTVGTAARNAYESLSEHSVAGRHVSACEWERHEGDCAAIEERARAAKLKCRAAKERAR